MPTLGDMIRGLMTVRCMNQKQLAAEASIAETNMSRIINDHLRPSEETLCRIADVLQADDAARDAMLGAR